jgi:hypothetical protein
LELTHQDRINKEKGRRGNSPKAEKDGGAWSLAKVVSGRKRAVTRWRRRRGGGLDDEEQGGDKVERMGRRR